jgi:hypothetical protein
MSDENLRDSFAAVRREDAAHAPALATLLGRSRPRHTAPASLRRLVPAIGVIAAGILFTVMLLRSGSERQPLVSLADARWQSPTDFLLRVPGAEYLESVPSIGRLPAVADSHPRASSGRSL